MSHLHGEAYNLMAYVSDDGKTGELIWNSRDGVTPFIIYSKDGVEMTHSDWGNDVYAPNFRPPPGMRVFVDLTQERALELAAEYVERHWDHPEYPMSSQYESRERAAAVLAKDYMFQPGSPDLIEAPAHPAKKKGPFA